MCPQVRHLAATRPLCLGQVSLKVWGSTSPTGTSQQRFPSRNLPSWHMPRLLPYCSFGAVSSRLLHMIFLGSKSGKTLMGPCAIWWPTNRRATKIQSQCRCSINPPKVLGSARKRQYQVGLYWDRAPITDIQCRNQWGWESWYWQWFRCTCQTKQ